MRRSKDQPASLLTDTVWRGKPREATDAELQRALALARRNHVEGQLARAYPQRLARVLAEVRIAEELLTRNLSQVASRLGQAGVPAVLIKANPPGGCVANDFDLVVRDWQWDGVLTALAGWYVHSSRYWLERRSKALLYPPVGPALHLHGGVSWFGVPVLSTAGLLARSSGNSGGCLTPAPADQLRIWLAHALFQELALNLSELFAVRTCCAPW